MNTTYWLNKMISTIYPTSGKTYYIGLSSTIPTASGSGVTEPSGNGYARVALSQFTAANGGIVKSASNVVFPTSTGAWFPPTSPAKCWVMFEEAGSNANVLACGELNGSVAVWASTTLTIPAGEIQITISDGE